MVVWPTLGGASPRPLHLVVRSDVLSPEELFHSQILHRNFLEAASIAAFAVVAYEHALTFADEVNHIWMTRQSLVTVSFLLLRYLTVIGRIFDVFLYSFRGWTQSVLFFNEAKNSHIEGGYSCGILLKNLIPSLPLVISIFLVHIIMILRICALYGDKTGIRYFLIVLLVVEILIMVLPMYLLRDTFHGSDPTPHEPVHNMILVDCIAGSSDREKAFVLYWVSPLLVDTALFALTIWKSNRYAKSIRNFPLLRVLVRDGFLYYVVVGLTHLLNLMMFLFAPTDLGPVASGFSQALTTTIVCRLVLNLRMSNPSRHSTDADEDEDTSSLGLGPLTTISPTSLLRNSTSQD